MDNATEIALLNTVSAALIFYAVFSHGFLLYPQTLRIGLAIAATGQTFQAIFNYLGVDTTYGIGQLWVLRDIGLSIVAVSIITDKYGQNIKAFLNQISDFTVRGGK